MNRDDPESLDFLCSCETLVLYITLSEIHAPLIYALRFKRDAWYVPNDKSDSGGEACVGYGIASVFTPEKNRGKGYAKHMMRLLHWVLAKDEYLAFVKAEWPVEWGEKPNKDGYAGDALFSALWSDVGPDFYARCGMGLASRGGWEVLDAKMCVWDVDSVDCSSVLEEEWEWLDEKRVNDVWKDDADMMKHELCAQECTFLPDKGVGDFQIDRKREGWVKMQPVPKYWGVRHVKDGLQRYATWTIEKREEGKWVMVITRLRGSLEGVIAGIAKKHGVTTIECWGIGDTKRTDHLTAVKWYSTSGIDLRFNEK